MSQDNTKPPRARRLRQLYYDAADTLSGALRTYPDWTPDTYEVTTERERRRIMREITRLADECGVEHKELTYGQTYVAAIKALGGTDEDSPRAQALRRLAEEIDGRKAAKWKAEREAKAAPKPAAPREYVIVCSEAIPHRPHVRPVHGPPL